MKIESLDRSLGRPWIWLTLPPLAAVIGAIITIYLALANPDPVVRDSTHQLGKAMLADNQAAERAQQLDLHAQLEYLPISGEIRVRLAGAVLPPVLSLVWGHPTNPGDDHEIRLSQLGVPAIVNNTHLYRGYLSAQLAARGYWLLQDLEQSWALQGASDSLNRTSLKAVIR